MRIYLAGPMRSYPGSNSTEFASWAKVLRYQGYVVVSPAELDEDGLWDGQDVVPDTIILRDLNAVLAADAVATLPGWEHSPGANAEVAVAKWARKPVLAAEVLAAHRLAEVSA